jgi:hypothetical protein
MKKNILIFLTFLVSYNNHAQELVLGHFLSVAAAKLLVRTTATVRVVSPFVALRITKNFVIQKLI